MTCRLVGGRVLSCWQRVLGDVPLPSPAASNRTNYSTLCSRPSHHNADKISGSCALFPKNLRYFAQNTLSTLISSQNAFLIPENRDSSTQITSKGYHSLPRRLSNSRESCYTSSNSISNSYSLTNQMRQSNAYSAHSTSVLCKVHDCGVILLPGGIVPSVRYISRDRSGFSNIHGRISSLQAKKRVQRKKKLAKPLEEDEEDKAEILAGFTPKARHKFLTFDPDFDMPEVQIHRPPPREWQVTAYATANEYDLEGLLKSLSEQGLYIAAPINPGKSHHNHQVHSTTQRTASSAQDHYSVGSSSSPSTSTPDAEDVLHVVATYRLEQEPREIYFFREGSVVFWNVSDLERSNVLRFLKKFEDGKYSEETVEEESESLPFAYNDTLAKTKLVHDRILLNPEGATDLEKYTFSNALAMSVKLGIWEASLDEYIENIESVTEELGKTGHVVLTQDQVLQRMGQLFALRHLINLSSDLLDTPDFYWDHDDLEQLYQRTCNHLSISKRTSVMNVKLGHCVELMELLKGHLGEKHSQRLEWIIIILIMVEVGFELLHYLERLL